MTDTTSLTNKQSGDNQAYSIALLRTLKFAKVKFVRYMALDLFNTPRCKAVPVDHLLSQVDNNNDKLQSNAVVATVCFGGMPTFADAAQPASGLDARGVLRLEPDMRNWNVLPYTPQSALTLCSLVDPVSNKASDLCTRTLLQDIVDRALEEDRLRVAVGVELEFCLYSGNAPADQTLYASPDLLNDQQDFIGVLYDQLQQQCIAVELVHAESNAGQLEVVLRYQTDPVALADGLVLARETIRNLAKQSGLVALFLPKINEMAAGSGCHFHFSLQDVNTGRNIFVDETRPTSNLSNQGGAFVEGILQHLPALQALTMPTTNSFRRVGPGCWTGSLSTWAVEDKEVPLRVCRNTRTGVLDRVEYKLCDNTANPYLALAGILIAGLHGLRTNASLRPSRGEVKPHEEIALAPSLTSSLFTLEHDELLMSALPATLTQAYLAVRRVEAERAATMTLHDEVKEAFLKA